MILVVDFGSQTAHLIGRRLRQLGVSTRYVYPEKAFAEAVNLKPKGIIFSGGPSSVYEHGAPTIPSKIFSLNIPLLGICYGWQLTAHVLGGSVKNTTKEYGPQVLRIQKSAGIFHLPKNNFRVIVSHGDTVTKLPPGFTVTGSTHSVKFTAVANEKRKLYGVQFHPEADYTEYGLELLENFAVNECGEILKPLALDPRGIIAAIKRTVGNKKVLCAVSGGIDSTVAAYLIGKAIGKNLIPVYVDSGLMRPDTDKKVRYIFTKLIHADLVVVHAKKQFLSALKKITDPEEKRKTIGKLYVDIFQEQARLAAKRAKKHKGAVFLGQGTIYSDVIESKGSKYASHIKSHHNVGGLPASLHMKLIEPMRHLYKDEVRKIGKLAGLPENIVNAHPFPGPGFAVRIRGEVTPVRLAQVKQADAIVIEEITKAHLYDRVFQCFAVMTGACSTAVKGDSRVFAEVVAIRAYGSRDVMTSQWARIPHDVLGIISSRIVNEVPNVSRVVYDITTKPPATMEWE
jgi:GMP synthase (glutamine-hydrolysing)